jgi:hypothetical protein
LEKIDVNAAGPFVEGFEVIAFAESWCSDPPQIQGYQCYNFPRVGLHPKAKRGSGGICIYVRNQLYQYVKVVKHYFDCIVWINIGGENKTESIMLCLVYFPPDGSLYNYTKDDYFDILENDIVMFKKDYPTIVCGDVNARTASFSDMCFTAEGSDIPSEQCDIVHKQFPPVLCKSRVSQDQGKKNKFGLLLIDMCKSVGMRILNGRVIGDTDGKFTTIESNSSSIIGYALCEPKGFKFVEGFEIGTKMPESDHCPLLISLLNKTKSKSVVSPQGSPAYKYVTRDTNKNELNKQLSSNECTKLSQMFYTGIQNNMPVDYIINKWSDMIEFAMAATFRKVKCQIPKPKIAWLDDECKGLREQIVNCQSRSNLIDLLKHYRTVKQKKKRNYKRKLVNDLDSLCGKEGKLFWATINSLPANVAKKHKVESHDIEGIHKQMNALSHIPNQVYFDRDFERECQSFLQAYDDGEFDKILGNCLESSILNDNISQNEIASVIQNLKGKNAPGIDLIQADCIKMCSHQLVPHLEVLLYVRKSNFSHKMG